MAGANALFEMNQFVSDKPHDRILTERMIERPDLTVDTDTDDVVRMLIPRDYNEQRDELKVRLLAELTSGSTTVALSVGSVTRRRAGASNGSPSVAAQSQDVASGNPVALEFDLSGNGFQAGDVVELTIAGDGGTGSTDVVTGYGAKMEYGSSLVNYDFADR